MNSIINQNLRETNSMDSLSFHWTAAFKDDSDLMQFNEDGTENKFKLVQERINELIKFYLYNKDLSKIFIVDLINGRIGYNYLPLPYIESKEKKANIRLIFFRRHQVVIGTQDLKEQSHTIEYHLGYQWATNNNENRNIVLLINQNGDFIINEK